MKRDLSARYFDWLKRQIASNNCISFDKLLHHLYGVNYTPILIYDENRSMDGIELRWRFVSTLEHQYEAKEYLASYLDGGCTVLEMMIALALRMEQTLLYDPSAGDRTYQWFFEMINSLGLGTMFDEDYDESYVNYILDRFMNNEYKSNGDGGLFFVRHASKDLRSLQIWDQMMLYINEMYGY